MFEPLGVVVGPGDEVCALPGNEGFACETLGAENVVETASSWEVCRRRERRSLPSLLSAKLVMTTRKSSNEM